MNSKQFRKYRILFYRSSCPHCSIYLRIIGRINAKLPIKKRIELVDCEYERYGIVHPLSLLFNKFIDGYPVLFFDGIKKSGANSVIQVFAWLESILNREYINNDVNEHMFNQECEFKKNGLIKRVVCKDG